MSYSQPSAGGDQFDAKDYNGALLLVFPKSFSAETPTAHGISPSSDVDLIVVDVIDQATGMPKYFENARLFGNLAKSVSRDIGGAVLGRLGQVPTQRGNPAWVLQNYTPEDVVQADPATAAYKAGQFRAATNPMSQPSQPQQPQAAPAPVQAPYQAQATQQQWQAPAPAASAPPQQAWNAPAATPAAAPAQQQWQAPPAAAPAPTPAPPSAPAAPPAGADPALLAHLANHGITLPPTTPQAQAEAIAATLPS